MCAAQGQKARPVKVELTATEKLFRRNCRLWLVGAGAALIAYVLLSGQYIKVADMSRMMANDGDDEDDDDDEGGDE